MRLVLVAALVALVTTSSAGGGSSGMSGMLQQGSDALLATTDHGRTWRAQRSPCAHVYTQVGVAAAGRRDAWAVCATEGAAGLMGKAIYRTTNRGRGWTRLAVTSMFHHPRRLIGGISLYGYPQGIAFASDGHGLLWESRGTLYVTADAGRDWRGLPNVARPEEDFARSAAMVRRGHGFVLLGDGRNADVRLLRTDDGGKSWRVVRRWR